MTQLETLDTMSFQPPSPEREVLAIRRNGFFTLSGTLLFKRIIPTGGDLARRQLHYPSQIGKYNEESLRHARGFVKVLETIHWAGLFVMTGASGIILLDGNPDVALIAGLINIPLNIYPILLQRYNWLRLNHALHRYNRIRSEHSTPFLPSPEEL